MRITCPKCKMSQKLTLMWRDTDAYSTSYTREYECSFCGCAFEATYELTNTKILNVEKLNDRFYKLFAKNA
jgi:hypothetical protein